MIKISHEVPLALLDWSLDKNDYEYILPYFWLRYPEYRDFYIKAKEMGRWSILDNGLFEGETYSNFDLINFISSIEPSVFIVPDEWNDSIKTYEHAKTWKELERLLGKFKCELMIVLQGKSTQEMINLIYKCIELGYTHFALNHSSTTYDEVFPHLNKDVSKMMGRIGVVHSIKEQLSEGDLSQLHFHLLGCTLPQEFMYYSDYDFIKTLDTSNPIIKGLECELYGDGGNLSKPKKPMKDYFDLKLAEPGFNGISHLELDTIEKNVETFRKYIKW